MFKKKNLTIVSIIGVKDLKNNKFNIKQKKNHFREEKKQLNTDYCSNTCFVLIYLQADSSFFVYQFILYIYIFLQRDNYSRIFGIGHG